MALKASLVDPSRTAIVINEFQRGVVGDASAMTHIAESARPAIDALVRLLAVARPAGVTVVHSVIKPHPDGRGANRNTAFAAISRKRREAGQVSHVDPEVFGGVLPELGPDPGDFVLPRLHGMSPMADTGVDSLLRNLGVTTVVCAGASLNIGIIAATLDAMNRGYDVVVAGDACSAIPAEYGADMLRHSFPIVSRVTTTDELIAIWSNEASA